MKNFIFYAEDYDTEISPEEQLDLIPSITTRKELNQIERLNIKTARVWAMRKSVLSRSDLLTDGFARELHRRMFGSGLVATAKQKRILGGKFTAYRKAYVLHTTTQTTGLSIQHIAYPSLLYAYITD